MELKEPKSVCLIELHYLPNLYYLALLCGKKEVVLCNCENYQKQSYRNRSLISGAAGIQTLVVPVLHSGQKQTTAQTQPDNGQRWAVTHWRTLEAAYRKSAYFMYYADELHRIITGTHHSLFDLNAAILTFCLKVADIQISVVAADRYISGIEAAETGIQDFRNLIHPKNRISFNNPPAYRQVFGREFVPGLGIADALFCGGPETPELVRRYATLLSNDFSIRSCQKQSVATIPLDKVLISE